MKHIEHWFNEAIESDIRQTAGSDEPTAGHLTATQRDHLIRSVIGSQAIEGVEVSREEAEAWLDELLDRRSRATPRK